MCFTFPDSSPSHCPLIAIFVTFTISPTSSRNAVLSYAFGTLACLTLAYAGSLRWKWRACQCFFPTCYASIKFRNAHLKLQIKVVDKEMLKILFQFYLYIWWFFVVCTRMNSTTLTIIKRSLRRPYLLPSFCFWWSRRDPTSWRTVGRALIILQKLQIIT